MSRVIFKLRFKHPNRPDTVAKNISHVEYIATRSGVDKTISEAELERELDADMSSISAAAAKSEPEPKTTNEDFVQYIDKRPRSHGLFGDGKIEDYKTIQDELSTVNSYVWRGIISLRENDAVRLGFTDKQAWVDMVRKKIPDIANELGIPITNLRWCAAVHMEKGHPHTHVLIWEKEPKILQGIIKPSQLTAIRKGLTDEIFESERLALLQEKNTLRDLIRDLAQDDIGKLSQIQKDIKAEKLELKALDPAANVTGISPRLFSEDECRLAGQLEELSYMLPKKGRISLKFMPPSVKEKVRVIADGILEQPEFTASVTKYLNSVEELTKLYTNKAADIKKARENAYKDIRDHVAQIILRGAVELSKDNKFYIDQDLADRAVKAIKNINSPIDLSQEHYDVASKIASVLSNSGYKNNELRELVIGYCNKENLKVKEEILDSIINDINNAKEDGGDQINSLGTNKKIDQHIAVMKLIGKSEEETYLSLNNIIRRDSELLEKKLHGLEKERLLQKDGDYYKLTDKGVDEFINIVRLDRAEKHIVNTLHGEGSNGISFDELLKNKDIFDSLFDKDPEEFKVARFDYRVYELFREANKDQLTLPEIEAKIFERHQKNDATMYREAIIKAEKEFNIYTNRIHTLCVNGYMSFDKSKGTYSFTEEGKKAVDKLPRGMVYSKYDAEVTLSYIDRCEDGVLTTRTLDDFLKKEIPVEVKRMEQSKYLLKRLDFLKKEGYLEGAPGEYRLTAAGIKRREELLAPPQKRLLEKALTYLEELGLVQVQGSKYYITEKYQAFINNNEPRQESDLITKEIKKIIETTQNRIDVGKLQRNNERKINNKYLKVEYGDVKTDYDSIRRELKVAGTSEKTLKSLAVALRAARVDEVETKEVLVKISQNSGIYFEQEKIDKICDIANQRVKADTSFGKSTIIHPNDWQDMFRVFGVKENNIPTWMYRHRDWGGSSIFSTVNDIWKSVWRALEQQRLQTEAQAELMTKHELQKQLFENKEFVKDYIRKHKDHGFDMEADFIM